MQKKASVSHVGHVSQLDRPACLPRPLYTVVGLGLDINQTLTKQSLPTGDGLTRFSQLEGGET